MRECGPCTACCTALAVAELRKSTFHPCVYQGEAGCSIYGSRPTSCADYHCLWIQGHLGEDDRPDRLGVIFTTTRDPAHPQQGTLPMLVEYRDGALEDPPVREAIARLLNCKPVVLMNRRSRQVLRCVPVTVAGRTLQPAGPPQSGPAGPV